LLAVFHDAEKKDDAPLRVGPEMEKSGVFRADGSPVPFDGERGVARILDEHVRRFGWTPESEFEGGPVIALRRGETAITLEPSCQFELSGAPMADIHGIAEEFRVHMDELTAITKPMGIAWLGIGFQPFATRGELPWVPKMRYGIMRRYLPTRGDLALDMMQRTCTVQANFDFTDEQDAMRKLRVALRLAPLTTAIFANSPFYEGGRSFPGAPQGGPTFRGKVWLHTDPDRSGLVPGVFKENSTYVDYVEWALDVPMFMFKRDGAKVENTGQTFRDFLANGFEGHRATQDDWTSHLNTLFPEVRLKRTIEVRGADAQPHRYAFALPALTSVATSVSTSFSPCAARCGSWACGSRSAARASVTLPSNSSPSPRVALRDGTSAHRPDHSASGPATTTNGCTSSRCASSSRRA
jgi:glutamate--cysteine ligase